MKYLLALQVRKATECNATVVYNDDRLLYATLIDGVTGMPLLFDTLTECENAQSILGNNHQVIPVHHMIMVQYPKKSVFATNQFYHSPQPS